MLKEGYLNENFRLFHLKDTAGDERDYHYHEFDKVVILLSGKVEYAVENDLYALNPYNVLLIRHHAIHKALIDRTVPYERVIIYLNENRYSRILPEAALTSCFDQCLYFPPKEELARIIDRMEHSGNAVLRETSLIDLLAVLNSLNGSVPERSHYNEKMESILSYINDHLSDDLSVDILSAAAHLSKYHFMRWFKEHTGQTVHAYVRQRRLLEASRRIRQGIPIVQAASLSGFEDYSVFYKAFKDEFGFSPKELKEQAAPVNS